MLGKYSVRQQYVCIAEFMKKRFSTFSLLNERGESSFMQLCQIQCYSFLEAFIKVIKASVTSHVEGNVLLLVFKPCNLLAMQQSNSGLPLR